MRKREEIEDLAEKVSSGEGYEWELYNVGKLQLEVLLDIRDLLSPHPLDLASMNPEQQRKFIEEWKRAENDRP